MSNRVYGTEKVDSIIGLQGRKAYDKIDVFVDIANNNNVWAMVYYTEYKNHKPIKKQEIVRFTNHQSMMEFIRENFDGYELSHPVDNSHKHIFFHYINYCDLKYYWHNGKPKLNYLELHFLEYENNRYVGKTIRLPKEYEEMFLQILKISKKIPDHVVVSPKYFSEVDAYEEKANNRKEIVRSITLSIGEFFSFAGDKIRKISLNKKKIVKNLKIFVSVAALSGILLSGYAAIP